MSTLLNLLSSAFSKNIIAENSLGHSGNLAPDGQNIPGWSLTTLGHTPKIYTDRVALTPPVPGNTRGALWSTNPVNAFEWTAELEFRASGQAPPGQQGGSIQLWYVQNKDAVGQSGIYSVGQFDGLGIIIDQYGNKGGAVRGFLNDGGETFNSHGNLDSVAFGHCDFQYRNLGRTSKLRVSSNKGLTVSVDDKPCFSSEKVTLPKGYFFGITAATSDNPDSFEIFKFGVAGQPVEEPPHHDDHNDQNSQQQEERRDEQQGGNQEQLSSFPGSPEALPDRTAEEINSNEAQFADLHNRLQSLQHQLADMNAQFKAIGDKIDSKHNEIISGLPSVPVDAFGQINRRLENTERVVQQIQRDVEGRDYKQHLGELQEAINNVRGGIVDGLPESMSKIVTASAPSMGFFLFIVIGVQIFFAGAYILYKRRRANAPKKYL